MTPSLLVFYRYVYKPLTGTVYWLLLFVYGVTIYILFANMYTLIKKVIVKNYSGNSPNQMPSFPNLS